MRRWNCLIFPAILLLAYTLTACGSFESNVKAKAEQSEATPRISGPLDTVAAAGDARGGAVAHVATVNGSPQTVVSNLANGHDTVIPAAAPLLSPTVWVTATDIGVVGAVCHAWKSGEPPHWDDNSERNLPELCGSVDYRGWLISRSSGAAKQMPFPNLDGTNGVVALGTRDDEALLLTKGFDSTTYVLDTQSGHVAPVPAGLDTGGSAEAQYIVCLGEGGHPFATLAWSGDPPPSIKANGWEDQVTKLDDGSAIVTAVPSESGSWVPIHITGSAPTFRWQKGCDQSGMWSVGNSGGGRIDVSRGKALLTAIASPLSGKSDTDTSVTPLWGGGPPLAEVQPPLTAETVQGQRDTSGYVWRDASWRAIDTVGLGPSSIAFQNGSSIAALQERPGEVSIYELEMK